MDKNICFFEVKRQVKRININLLQQKAQTFLALHKELQTYKIHYQALSLAEIDDK